MNETILSEAITMALRSLAAQTILSLLDAGIQPKDIAILPEMEGSANE